MLTSLRRVSDRLVSEAGAWLGKPEKLGLKVISYVKPDTLSLQTGFGAGVTCVMPEGISGKIIEAQQQNRKIMTIYVKDPKTSEGIAYVITIDVDRERVDRELSSWQLLEDYWGWHRGLPKTADVPDWKDDTSDDYHVNLLDFLYAFGIFAVDPAQQRYRRMFLARQAIIAKAYGYSHRFESLVSCLVSQLDPETCGLFTRAMKNLWKHEQWLERKVDFGEAKRVLSVTPKQIQTYDHNAQYWEMHDPGPQIAEHRWIDEEGNRIAFAEVFGDGANPKSSKTSAKVYVFGSLFAGEEADSLLGCFSKKS